MDKKNNCYNIFKAGLLDNTKKIFSVFVCILFLGVIFSTSLTSSKSINDEEINDCPLCNEELSEKITLSDLNYEEQIGLVAMVILYMKFESEIVYYDSLERPNRIQYLNSLFNKDDLANLYDNAREEDKQKLAPLVDLSNGKISFINTETSNQETLSYPIETTDRIYDPHECTKHLSVPIKNFYNNYVEPVLAVIGLALSSINLTILSSIAITIINLIPNPGLLSVAGILKGINKFGNFWLNNIQPIIDSVKDYPITTLTKPGWKATLVVWSVIAVISIYCIKNFCGEQDTPIQSNEKTSLQNNLFPRLKEWIINIKILRLNGFLSDLFNKENSESNILDKKYQSFSNSKPTFVNHLFQGPKSTFKAETQQSFYACFRTDPGETLTYQYEWGDNCVETRDSDSNGEPFYSLQGPLMSHSWLVPGKYTVTITATDNTGLSSDPKELTYTVEQKRPFDDDVNEYTKLKTLYLSSLLKTLMSRFIT